MEFLGVAGDRASRTYRRAYRPPHGLNRIYEASHNSFQRKDPGEGGSDARRNIHSEKRRNDTHRSKTDREARLYKKSYEQEAKLSYLGHTVVENRNGLVVAAMATQADGTAERDAGLLMVAELTKKRKRRITFGADKAYDTKDFVDAVRELSATPHVTQNNTNRRSAVDGRTTRHTGYHRPPRRAGFFRKLLV